MKSNNRDWIIIVLGPLILENVTADNNKDFVAVFTKCWYKTLPQFQTASNAQSCAEFESSCFIQFRDTKTKPPFHWPACSMRLEALTCLAYTAGLLLWKSQPVDPVVTTDVSEKPPSSLFRTPSGYCSNCKRVQAFRMKLLPPSSEIVLGTAQCQNDRDYQRYRGFICSNFRDSTWVHQRVRSFNINRVSEKALASNLLQGL